MTAATSRSAACPNCGAPIRFRWAQAVQTTCEFCRSILVRRDLDLEKIGQQAEFPVTGSPVQLGMEGRWHDKTFLVVGRLSYAWARGRWNEWYCRLSDASSAWLSDAQLEYAMTREVAPGRSLPHPATLKVGDTLETPLKRYVVTSLTQAEYVGSEGELPFTTGDRELCWFADLSSGDEVFATLDGSVSPPLLFVGEYLSWQEMAPTGFREFAGW